MLPSVERTLDVETGTQPIAARGLYAGHTFGGYRLHRQIASGGMAEVYLASRSGPGGFAQLAAVKVIHPELANRPDIVEMFMDEARIAASINHPNVIKVFDFGCAEGTHFLAMEHLMGRTWAQVKCGVLEHGTDVDRALLPKLTGWVVSQACEGLHAAHQAKDPHGRSLRVVHRDISPQNIFVGFDGSVRVLDFGIASAIERLHHTAIGSIKGRFSYMSPEQMRGETVDHRSDIWSTGVVLWESVTHSSPFRRSSQAATMAAVCAARLPAVVEELDALQEELLSVARRALQRDPNNRFASAREMGAALTHVLAQRGPFSSADASACMQRVFRDSIEQVERQRREAAQELAGAGAVAAAPAEPQPTPRWWWSTPAGAQQAPLDAPPQAPAPSLESSVTLLRGRPKQARRRGTLSLLVLGMFVGAVVVFLRGPFGDRAAQDRGARASRSPRLHPPTAAVALGAKPSSPAPKDDRPLTPGAVPPAPQPEASQVVEDGARTGDDGARTDDEAAQGHGAEQARRPRLAAQRERARRRRQAHRERERRARRGERAYRLARRRERERAAGDSRPSVVGPPGTLNVTTPGCWGTVYVDGRKLGVTPGRFVLPAGAHVVEVALRGQRSDARERVTIPSHGTERLRVDCP